jgi:regulator of protease activity HflC (stomatin/prohibitin superfamily)
MLRGIAGMLSIFFVLLILLFASMAQVDAGSVAVLTLFGRVQPDVLDAGIHFVNPFTVKHQLTARTQELKESAAVPSSEGLVIALDASLLFHLDRNKAPEVYQKLGEAYLANIVEPTLRSAIREATASHTANALYSSEREKVAAEVYATLRQQLVPRGIEPEQVLLRDIQLPATLKTAIEAKQQAEQESLAMLFRLQKERQEADRKRIEAEGIRDFQKTVTAGISEQLLTWKGIEATEKLADSQNTKIVIIGNTKNGLPLVLQ